MTELLLRLFVKNYRRPEDPAVRGAIGKLGGIVGIIANGLLFLGKLLLGVLSGSVSVTADALNNLSDAASSLVTLWGFRLAGRPADEDHPYGHARYEYLSGLLVAALILVIGAELAISSVGKIFHPTAVDFSLPLLLFLLAAVLLKGWMVIFYTALAKRIHSAALRATAADCRGDMIATGAVLLCGVIQHFTAASIDGFAGLAVAVFILTSGIRAIRETVSPLLGTKPDAALAARIEGAVLSCDKVLGIHDLMIHDYGPGKCFASIHAEISTEEDPLVCHEIIDRIERDVFETLNVHLVIHHDPITLNDGEQNRMRQAVEEIVLGLGEGLSVHDFRLVREADHTKLLFDVSLPFALHTRREDIKEAIDKALHQRGFHYVTVIRFDGAG